LGILKYCTEAPVAALIDLRTQNIATLETRGFDLQTTYGLDVGHSRMSFGLLGTYLLQYSESQLPTDPLYSRLNTPHYPINFRLNGTLTWCSGGLGVGSVVHFQNGYRDTTSVPTRSVRSWTTQDLVISLTWPDSEAGEFGSRPGQQVQTSLRISNVLNASPPFLNNFLEHIGYDEENGNLLGRMVSLTVRERW
jgi:outer membrane receptor protein involved in Fe transport